MKIILRDLRCAMVLGIYPHEKAGSREVIFTITLTIDPAEAIASDAIGDTVDYDTLASRIRAYVASTPIQLIETVAARVADLILEEERVQMVTVTVDKPAAMEGCRSVAIEYHKSK